MSTKSLLCRAFLLMGSSSAIQIQFNHTINSDPSPPQTRYAGHLEYVFADIKKPLAGLEGSMSSNNYKAIIDGLQSNLHCNGVRIGIHPNITDPTKQDKLFSEVWEYSKSKGLTIYASPLGTGTFEKSRDAYIKWVTAFANEWQPDVFAPFNEAGLEGDEYVDYGDEIKSGLTYSPKYVGPEKQHVDGTMEILTNYPELIKMFDVTNSHNAVDDVSATASNWKKLADMAGSAIWATENPRNWSATSSNGDEVGVKAVVETEGLVTGLVIYLAYPNSVNDDGTLTAKGKAIADGIYSGEGGGGSSKWWSPIDALKSITDRLR